MKRWLLILGLLLSAGQAEAVTRYVDACTNNTIQYNPTTRSCTTGSDRVYSTITNGINAATLVAGDILDIRSGTYVETINYANLTYRPVGTSFANAPIIRGHAGETVTLRGINIYGNAAWKYVKFENLIIDANNVPQVEAIIVGAGTVPTAPSFIRFTNCEAKNADAAGAVAFYRCVGCEWIGDGINGNSAGRIRDNGTNPGFDHGMYVYGTGTIVDGAEITNNCAYGIHGFGSQLTNINNGVIFRNNYIHDNVTCGDAQGAAGIFLTQSTNGLIYNNILENNNRGIVLGLGFSGTPSGVGVYNNSIYGNSISGILINPTATSNILRNNIVMGGAGRIVDNGSGTICEANLTSDSSIIGCAAAIDTAANTWTNPVADDFTLKQGSKAIGTGGELSSIFTLDFNGATRTLPWDLGAIKAPSTPTLTLLTPNGGNLGQTGSMQTFTWSRTDEASVPNVRLLYDAAYDGTFNATSTLSATTTNDGSFDFTAPAVTTTGRFRVEDVVDGVPFDESDANVTITAAAGGSITLRISNNTSGTHQGNIGGVISALLGEATPDFNFGISSGIRANKFGAGNHTHTVLKFPTNSIPSNATVTAAELGLYLTAFTAAGTPNIDFRNNKRSFVQNEATWTIYSNGNNWGTPGGLNATDRDSAVVCNMPITLTTFQYYTCSSSSLTALVQNWVDLDTPNNGLHLERNGTGNDGLVRTFGAENPTAAYLSITYTTSTSTITLTSPLSGAHFFPGKVVPIHWQSQGISGSVRILMSPNAGLSYTEIEESHPFGQVDYIWLVPPMQSSSSVVFKVESVNDSAVFDVSDPIRIGGRRTGLKQ